MTPVIIPPVAFAYLKLDKNGNYQGVKHGEDVVVLREGFRNSKELEEEIKIFIKHRLAAHAYPREIEFCANLPKTRSGKIMRRLLKARDLGLPTGDISTLED